jgi:transcriptional regulator with XRE-family HTH domain
MDAVPFCGWARLTVKAQKQRDYSEDPQTLGEHLKKRRRELGLLQRETAGRMGVSAETVANWEKGKTRPATTQFRPVVEFLGYDPMPEPKTLADRLEAKRRATGMTFSEVARHLGWDPGTLTRYLNGTWRMPPARLALLESFLVTTATE